MNLLPKSEINFAERDYWETFFKNRDNKEFEWYGEYPELCSQLHKYIKPKDDILVVGCGNSQLSANMYDVGYKKITNIDVSTVAVKQMKQQNKDRDQMTFEVMDALNTTFDDGAYSAVLDKGTLDALMPQDTASDIERGSGLFKEVSRVLKIGGRYVIISLLQKHILRTILDSCMDLGWMLRICRCHEVEDKTIEEFQQLKMPVFMIICTKFKKQPNIAPLMELALTIGDKPLRVSSSEEVINAVKEVQDTNAMCNAVRKQVLKEELEMEFKRDGETSARYLIRVVDRTSEGSGRLRSYGALIVPHGRETEWMFGTTSGRELLRKSSNFDRLAVISLSRDHIYPSMKEIQQELSPCVKQLAPSGAATNIPYVTVGDGLGSRTTVHRGTSQLSGDYVVEDVDIDGEKFRRLIFMNNQAVIQSEAKLKSVSKKGGPKWIIDPSYVSCAHHCYMGIAVAMSSAPCRTLVLGLGGGGLCLFLQKVFPNVDITAVDIDPAIVEVAKNQFGLTSNENLRFEIADGLAYLKTCRDQGKNFDVVLIDVDAKSNESGLSCPPAEFVSSSTLDNVAAILGDSGLLALNVVCRVEALKKEIVDKIRQRFALAARYALEEDVNEVILATCQSSTSEEWRKRIETSAQSLNKDGKKKMARKEDLLDLPHMVKNLSITMSD